MSNKNVTIALILEIWLGFDSKSLKLDYDMKTIDGETRTRNPWITNPVL